MTRISLIRLAASSSRPACVAVAAQSYLNLSKPRNSVRLFSTSQTRLAYESPHPLFPTITAELVQLVDPEKKTLSPLQPTRNLLRNLPSGTWLLQVSQDPPVVKIKNIQDHINEKDAQEAQSSSRRGSVKEKEIQVPWTAAAGDLSRKIEKAIESLQRGDRLTVIFAPKSGSAKKQVDRGTMNDIVDMFRERLESVGKRWRDDDVAARTRTCYWDPLPELRRSAVGRVEGMMSEQKKERLAKKEARRLKDEERGKKGEEEKKKAMERGIFRDRL